MRLQVQNLRKYYKTEGEVLNVLQGIDFSAEKGEFISIMGPSGSGKSTLLFLIGLLDVPTAGSIFLDDVEASAESETNREYLRLNNIGFVFQNFNLLPHLTALENVMLPMQIAGRFKDSQRDRAMSLLRLLGVEKRANTRSSALSGGEQQRVAIGRALANAPSLLLADEPTGSLDVRTGKQIMEILRAINQNQEVTVIVVTHDPKVAAYADRIFYLDGGKLRGTAL
jgi:putative ABC transport system ATP-binding protein